MTTLKLENVSKSFGDVKALESIDFEVGSGELVAMVGPSGCGKTTALRLVAGFEQPTSGRVLVDGDDVSRVAANQRNMGMVFQAYSLFPNMTAADNVAFGLRVRKDAKEKRSKRVKDLLEIVGLAHAAGRYPHELSGGMQQRVALARALAIEPRVLLLDEPLSALDAKVRLQLREEIRRVQAELGITTLYVTHDQEEALAISDRVAVLYEGRVEQVGTPAEIYDEPRTPFTAEFIGTMNRLQARVLDNGYVEYHDRKIQVDSVKGYREGDEVMVLVRPESLELSKLPAGSTVPGGTIEGKVFNHSFLGSVTRVKVSVADDELTADVSSRAMRELEIGDRVSAAFESGDARVFRLDREQSESSRKADLHSSEVV